MELLQKTLAKHLPATAKLELDAPASASGAWFLDARMGDKAVVIEWRRKLGFGISTAPRDGYGDGPDEVIEDAEKVIERVVSILTNEEQTASPPTELPLRGVRERRRVPQQELAERMGVRQATLAKIEKGGDVKIGTLVRYAAGLGGKLVVGVEFDDGVVRVETEEIANRSTRVRKVLKRRGSR